MARRIRRRDFLQLMAVSVAVSAVPSFTGCSDSGGGGSSPEDIERTFPQGIGSGDPRPDRVVLWTRVEAGGGEPIDVDFEVATDESFSGIVAHGSVTTNAERDFTVKIVPIGLAAFTTYFYRFTAAGVTSRTGRTKTAPTEDQDVPVRFAFASCQDFVGRYYHAWRVLTEQEEPVDFVLFLGDYIYETTGDPSVQPPDPARQIVLPDGLPLGESTTENLVAFTLADYRALYKQYRSDPDLKRVHELYPFISIWDDHEFANDCWQDHATDFNEARGDEKEPERRQAADRAWFEFQAVDVIYHEDAAYPDDIQIYRTFRFGRHVDLILTDERYYRSDHVIPEGPVDLSVGKFAANSSVGSRNLLLKSGFDPREASAAPTMLGETQKQWLIDKLTGSSATWKLWGNEVQLWQMLIDLSGFEMVPAQFRDRFYFSVDQWDGYRSERSEILAAIAGTPNVVALTGDIHAFYAADLYVDFDNPDTPVAVELVCAGISSASVQEETQQTIDASPTLKALGLGDLVPMFDDIVNATNPAYLRYGKSLVNGVATLDVRADAIEAVFLEIGNVRSPDFDGNVERVRLRCASGTNRVTRVT
jgi:alkaline phosphatase D